MARKRDKIKYCLDDYLDSLDQQEKSEYLLENSVLIGIIHSGKNDEEIMSEAKKYDDLNNTELFSDVIRFRVYCIACRKLDCDC